MQKTLVIRLVLVLIFIAGLWTAYTQGPRPAKIDVVKVKDDVTATKTDLDALAAKEKEIRLRHRLRPDVPILFVEAEVGDPSEFYQTPLMRIDHEHGLEVIRVFGCNSVAHVLAAMARAAQDAGAVAVRMQGVANLTTARKCVSVPIVGIIKRDYSGFEPYITPTIGEVRDVIAAGAEIVAFDATSRVRPDRRSIDDVVAEIHAHGRLALADCSTATSPITITSTPAMSATMPMMTPGASPWRAACGMPASPR